MSRNPRNLRPESSSLVSTSLTHIGDDEDSEDSGIISLFVLLESPESSHIIQLRKVCIDHCWFCTGELIAPCQISARSGYFTKIEFAYMRRSRRHGAIYIAHWGAVPFVGWALCPVFFKHSEGGGESPESPESNKSARQITRIRRAARVIYG